MGPIKGLDKQIITQRFSAIHRGVDLRCVNPAYENLQVIATEDSRVLRSGLDKYGNYFLVVRPLENTGFSELKYIHIDNMNYAPGVELRAGAKIGYCLIGGNSTSLHLHFEAWEKTGPVDPVEYFNVAEIDFKFKGRS